MTGILAGYLIYDCIHYMLHHGGPEVLKYVQKLRKNHLMHHYKQIDAGFGISCAVVDRILGTEIANCSQNLASEQLLMR